MKNAILQTHQATKTATDWLDPHGFATKLVNTFPRWRALASVRHLDGKQLQHLVYVVHVNDRLILANRTTSRTRHTINCSAGITVCTDNQGPFSVSSIFAILIKVVSLYYMYIRGF